MTQRFLELTKFWFEYVSCDHHKDRDCHFYINQVWSYGDAPYWRIEHYGYIEDLPQDLVDSQFGTYEEAAAAIEKWLLEKVKSVIRCYKDYNGEEDEGYNWRAVKIVANKYNHLLE